MRVGPSLLGSLRRGRAAFYRENRDRFLEREREREEYGGGGCFSPTERKGCVGTTGTLNLPSPTSCLLFLSDRTAQNS